jgi:hypothetical protein
MKKNFMQGFVMSFVFLFAVSCQKESKSPQESSTQANASKPESAGSCRLTSYDYYDGIGDFHDIDLFTYKNGLVDDVVFTSFGQRFNMEYNKQGKLIASRVYDGTTLLYIITFVYEKNRIVQEIWRDGITGEIVDEVFLTYDQKGNLARNESFNQGYFVTYTYTNDGRLESWKYFYAGLPAIMGEYTYEQNIKNPFRSLNGLNYGFWFINSGFGIGSGSRWYSSEKVSFYDENGNSNVYYEQDASQTVSQLGKQHYPMQVDYFDINTDLPITNTFQYENCEGGQPSTTSRINQNFGSKNSGAVNKIRPHLKKILLKKQ